MTVAADMPMSPGTPFQPAVVESAREMMWLYPSSATLVLPRLNDQEEQEIANLIQDKRRAYVTIKRDVSVATSNWKLVGSKKTFNIWQLHIKSPNALGMQAFFYKAVLPPELKIKIYSGQKGVTSHIDEYLGDTSTDPQNFWVTRVPGDTIVIEVWISQDSNLKPNTFPFEIKSINHYFRDVNGDLPSHSLHSEQQAQQAQQGEQAQQLQQTVCSVSNNTCNFGDDTNVHRAIANMLYTDSQGQTSRCTGSFLNNGNTTTNTELYFLTAFHCIYPGFSQNTQRGSDVDAQIYNSRSSCSLNSASESDQLVGNDVKFIAASEAADWALLWVNKSTLQRADGSLFGAISPTLLGWTSGRLADGSTLETLHHARSTLQNYAQFEFTAIANARAIDYEDRARSFFDSCQNIAGCTHYGITARTGGILGGASGSLLWNPRYQVRAVLTHGQDNQCVGYASRFDKIYEDGRVSCALDQGNGYYPQNTSNCDDAARPAYSNTPPSSRLSGLSLSTGTLHPSFDGSILRYFAAVPNNTRQLTLRFNTDNSEANITVNNDPVTTTATIFLSHGNNTISVGVQTKDSNRLNVYTIDIVRLAQRNFNPLGTWETTAIEDINSQCAFFPNLSTDDFDTIGREYDIVRTSTGLNFLDRVDSETYTEIGRQIPNRYRLQHTERISIFEQDSTLTAEQTETIDFILIADEEVIGAGVTTINVTNFEDISCLITYTVRAKKAATSTAMLKDISLSAGTLNLAFTGVVRDYSATVDSDVSQLGINIETSHVNQSITINGIAIPRRFNFSQLISSTVPLSVGSNTIVIGVTSADSISTSTYTLQATRQSPALTGLSLSAGTLNPSFNRERFQYAATVDSDVGRITLTPTANSARHRITITANGRSATGNVAPLNVGDNTIVISVSTQDNQGTIRYTLVVTRLEPCLTALSLSPGLLSPTFGNPNRCGNASTRYTATVASDVEQITLSPIANSARHRITITANGRSVAGNSVPLNVGNNNITISVSTRDNQGTIRYTLVVTRLDPCLTVLSSSPGSISPTFGNPNQCVNASTRYTATVASDTEQITLTPTANSARHRVFITANGISITGNVASLNVGDNTIVISVSTRDNKATARYTLVVTRLEPCLTALSLSSGSLSPAFGNPNQCGNASTRYTATVDSDIERITLTPTANGAAHRVSMTANGISITGNSVPVNVGNNSIVISVSTRDNQATTRYTLVVTRSEPCLTALSLSSGSLSPTFERCSDGTVNYSAIVRNDVSQIVITATADRPAHTITFNDNQNSTVPLSVGDNTITVSVITADGMARKNYNLVIRRLSTATLTGLAVGANSQMLKLNPDFSLINLDYRVSIENTMTTVTMMPTASAGRTIRIRYTPDDGTAINRLVASGDTITIAPLFFGTNDVHIDVMHNGATERYSLTMTIGIKLRIKLFLEGALQ